MGSHVSTKKPRLKKYEYELLLKDIDKQDFYTFYTSNGNEAVCKYFNISLNTMYRLIKDLNIILTPEQLKYRNKIATEQRVLELYGVENNFQREEVQEKIKQVNLEKYGVENVFAVEEIKDKIKETNLEKYGVEFSSQAEIHKLKSKKTCLEKYGVDNYAKTEECKEKIINTNLKKYGHTNAWQFGSEEFKQNMLSKYGVTSVSSFPEIQNKIKLTNNKKYGVDWFTQTLVHQQRLRSRYLYDNIYFDSFPELAVYIYCVDHEININRNYSTKFAYVLDGYEHYYYPDFEIEGRLVEIKGDHFFKEDGTMWNPFNHSQDALYEAKHQCMLQNKVEIWTSTEYKFALDYCKEINLDKSKYLVKNIV